MKELADVTLSADNINFIINVKGACRRVRKVAQTDSQKALSLLYKLSIKVGFNHGVRTECICENLCTTHELINHFRHAKVYHYEINPTSSVVKADDFEISRLSRYQKAHGNTWLNCNKPSVFDTNPAHQNKLYPVSTYDVVKVANEEEKHEIYSLLHCYDPVCEKDR